MTIGDLLTILLTATAIGIWAEIKTISNMYEGRDSITTKEAEDA